MSPRTSPDGKVVRVNTDLYSDLGITFYSQDESVRYGKLVRVGDGDEKLAVTVLPDGHWTLFKFQYDGGPSKQIGKSWIAIRFRDDEYPLSVALRYQIATNVIEQRRLTKRKRDKEKLG